jgi:Winged helix-turn-helix DNA-binding
MHKVARSKRRRAAHKSQSSTPVRNTVINAATGNQALPHHPVAIAEQKNILSHFDAALSRFAVGVSRTAKNLYLSLTTRLFAKPVSIKLGGTSCAGKSFPLEEVLKFFPAEAYFRQTGMSAKTLAYSSESFANRFIVLSEATALTSGSVSYLMRTLLTEGRIVYDYVQGGETHRRVKVGPTGLVTTTTANSLHHEMETRLFALPMDDSSMQTGRIIHAQADGVSGMGQSSDDSIFQPWREFQTLLANGERRVVIPYAPALSDLVPPVAVRLRRDFPAMLAFVQAHALLHREHRERDEQGRIVATLDDYGQVRSLLDAVVAEAVEQAVSKEVRETVQAVESIRMNSADGTATIQQLAQHLGIDRSAASRRVDQCLENGFLATAERRKGKQMKVMLGEPLPENRALLPTIEEIHQRLARRQSQQPSQSSDSRRGPR